MRLLADVPLATLLSSGDFFFQQSQQPIFAPHFTHRTEASIKLLMLILFLLAAYKLKASGISACAAVFATMPISIDKPVIP
jgi:hypothetical protein